MHSIYFFKLSSLYFAMQEIQNYLNYKLVLINKKKDFKNLTDSNFLIISQSNNISELESINANKVLLIERFPIYIKEFIRKVNIRFLQNQFNAQSKINIRDYILNLNSKIIKKDNINLKLTEKEVQILLYLNDKQEPQCVKKLQLNIWDYSNASETHTVETHVHRLRKKIYKSFKDNTFLINKNGGYTI